MNILSIENLGKSYGTKVLFENITLGVDKAEKIGLIGINGTGKSTLLKVIAGLEIPDHGKVTIGSGIHVEYLPQTPIFEEGTTVLEQVFKGSSPVMQLLRDYEYALDKLQERPDDSGFQQKVMELGQRMDAQGAWQLETEAKAVLTRLGILDFEAKVERLSGGMRKRIALASALINPADLLILDEPTNHIDYETVDWLEQYLNKQKGALLMITHDRYFLDRVVNKIFELDRGKLYAYAGNYSVFLEAKLLRMEEEKSTESKRQNLLRNELAWIRRGARARSTKQKARIDRFQRLQGKKPEVSSDKIEISVGSSRLGKKVIELNHVSKRFLGTKVIDDFSYLVSRDDRIGIIGLNGYGKSTLLNIIEGKLTPDQGNIERGETVKIGYFSQENLEMNGELKVIDYIREVAEILHTADGGVITASQMLERFLFPPHLQWIPIAKLSGGEKRRLCLLRILIGAPNVILLDEPTNDLDIQTLTILEEYLDEFPGAVLAVSHDRYFLDRIAEKLFVFRDNGVITQYTGNYSEYLEFSKGQTDLENKKSNLGNKPQVENSPKSETPNSELLEGKKDRPVKFSFKEQREYEQIDSLIANAEKDLQGINDQINLAGSNYALLQELVKTQQELEQKLDHLLERWTYLNELAEEINRNKTNEITRS
ncbi:MAG: ABC-F family ATP-binding cassette domain-containing protein [Desulfitobacteriaceae bacterium]